jgi:hypothetical protein
LERLGGDKMNEALIHATLTMTILCATIAFLGCVYIVVAAINMVLENKLKWKELKRKKLKEDKDE